jgi:ribonuclease P protein component
MVSRLPGSAYWRARRAEHILEPDREADLSTEQARAQAAPWLSFAHGDGGRPQGSFGAPGARPQASVRLIILGSSMADETVAGDLARAGTALARLRRRADFQRASRGRRAHSEAFVLQASLRAAADDGKGPRLGFTASKKVGGAVARNRIRRRLKEAVRVASRLETAPDHDYVIVARREALSRPFDRLLADVQRAFVSVHSRGGAKSGDRGAPREDKPANRDRQR